MAWRGVGTIRSLLGGWREAHEAAFGADALLPTGFLPRKFTDEQLVRAYESCARDLGGPPSQSAYEGWRNEKLAEGGRGVAVPFSHTLSRRLGGGRWSCVAVALEADLPRARRSRREFADDELVTWWKTCAAEFGHSPTQAEYDDWL